MTRHDDESNVEHLDARPAEIDRREERPEKETRGFMKEAAKGVEKKEDGEHRLKALTFQARFLHKHTKGYAYKALYYAVECGEILNQIKPRIKHGGYKGQGGWTKYVEEECGIPYRTANRYCLIADHKDLWPKNEYATVAHSYGVIRALN